MDAIRSESEPWSVFFQLVDWACAGLINHTPSSHYISRFGSRCVSLPAQRGTESTLSRGAVFVLRDLNKYEERSIVRLFGLRVSETRLFRFPQLSEAVLFFPSATQIRSQQLCFEKALSLPVRLACHVSPNLFLFFFPSSRAALASWRNGFWTTAESFWESVSV